MRKYLAGFTFIELLIVVMIISAFSGLSLAYYNNFNRASKMDTEANKLVQILELAKKKATTRDIQVPGTSCSYSDDNSNTFNGYQVALTPSGYNLNIMCKGVILNPSIYSYTHFPSSDIHIDISGGVTSVLFKPTPGQTDLSTDIFIKFTSLKSSSIKPSCIHISPSGIIKKSQTAACP